MVVVVVVVAAVWLLLLLSLVATLLFSASSSFCSWPDLGWKNGVDGRDVTTTITITIASDTITDSDIKAVFFLLKITTLHTPCFQDN
jgi:hypothetical protein